MSGARQTDVEAEDATTAAARMVVFAQRTADVWQQTRPAIEGLHADAPWSDDDTGRDFAASYLPSAEATAEAATAILDRLVDTGTAVGTSAISTELADEDSSAILRAAE